MLTAEVSLDRKRGDFLTLKIAVFGPGDPLYVWWGHIGLIVEDKLSKRSIFYDYGLFSFDNENFFLNFAFGRLLYSCGASPTSMNLERYKEQNRNITLYTLDLSPEKKLDVWRFAEHNILPENRNYYYHQFNDNCSTRIRDIIDMAIDGQLSEATSGPGRMTFREHVRRHTWFSPFFDWFLMFIMGENIDKQITEWDEMFLPGEVGQQIESFIYTGESGLERKLVSEKEVYFVADNRPAVREEPRRQWPLELTGGLIFAWGLAILRLRENRGTRITLGSLNALLGLFLGSAGAVVCFMSFFTNHDYSWHNLNTLFINPIFLATVPAGIIYATGRGGKWRFAPEKILSGVWTLTFTLAILSVILNLFPGIHHDNRITLAAFLPPAFVMSGYFRLIFHGKQKNIVALHQDSSEKSINEK
ncbi:MAG: DUF4105 domain-containing protein [Spirochaetales bacterium]|nr:DUF4105 domain-containing protein [Spirochaetales bacterium]